ncbi:MAG: hypothetical protein LBO04_05810 [Spirochaetaceae bacterium]|jgi:hypothetical protein|nr:hypothetical protein [Spirochaetaceae bacterium]
MNKTVKKITLFMLGVCAVPLFHACESSYLKSAMEALNPIPKVFSGMKWGDGNIVYVSPKNFSIAGTMGGVITGLFLNGGKRIWPNTDLQDKDNGKDAWRLVSSKEEDYPAGSIAAILKTNKSPSTAGTTGVSGDAITLLFGTAGGGIGYDFTGFPASGVKFSFILTPNAFHGADSASLSTDTLTRDFSLLMPTSTVYGKHWMEKHMYGTISAKWGEDAGGGSVQPGSTKADFIAGMISAAGSKAAAGAGAWLTVYGSTDFEFADDPAGNGSLSVISWETPPELSKGWANLQNYALQLTPIHDTSDTGEPFEPVRISVPVVFTSNVGSVSKAINAAIAAGTFGGDPNNDTFPKVLEHMGDADDPDGSKSGSIAINTLIGSLGFSVSSVLGSPPNIETSTLQNRTSQQTLTLTLGPGADESPANTLTFKVWVKQQ